MRKALGRHRRSLSPNSAVSPSERTTLMATTDGRMPILSERGRLDAS
ncbi:hypothetical protein NY08_1422 [Rhodococcus sp. B7740]|nr:hypothetical protein NY08_1422 [Rhodococcus sp. B7740]